MVKRVCRASRFGQDMNRNRYVKDRRAVPCRDESEIVQLVYGTRVRRVQIRLKDYTEASTSILIGLVLGGGTSREAPSGESQHTRFRS